MKNSDVFHGAVTKPYNTWSDIKMSAEAVRIQTSMTDNPLFPNPTPAMPVFSEAVGAYVLQLTKAGSRDMNAVAAKNARRMELTALCIQLGYSVSGTANGDVEALVSTALPLRRRTQPVVITPPAKLRITNGINPRDLDLKVDGMKGAFLYSSFYSKC